jgi:hypothetical protein
MVDEKTGAEGRTWMDFDARQPARELGKPARQESNILFPKPVRNAMDPDGMQAGVHQHHFQPGTRRRVSLEDRIDIAFDLGEILRQALEELYEGIG